MAITGQISVARTGQSVQVFQDPEDLNSIFSVNQAPSLQKFDHVTLYPGDFTGIDPIEIPENVFLTILPGANVNYKFSLNEMSKADRLSERYEDIGGNVENVADLNIAHLYETSIEKQFSRVRIYGGRNNPSPNPFIEFNSLEKAAQNAREGDSVVVFPGEYNPSKNLLVDNTTWKFLPGAIVRFDPIFKNDINDDGQTENISPYALFDDSRTFEGRIDNTPKNFEVFGDATFVVGSNSEKTVVSRDNPGENYNSLTISSQTTWFGWHKYSLLSVANPSSEVTFNAEKIRMENTIDGAIKYSSSRNLEVNVAKVEIGKSNKAGGNVNDIGGVKVFPEDEEPRLPAFAIINGHKVSKNSAENVEINISEFKVEEKENDNPINIITGLNHTPSDGFVPFRENFTGNVSLSVEKGSRRVNRAVSFSENNSPEKLKLENSSIYSPFVFEGGEKPTRLIIKNSSIKTENFPVLLLGNGENLDLSLSGAWLINDDENKIYAVKDDTAKSLSDGEKTDVKIKGYKNSFANKPIQNYETSLHDKLNNVIWTEDVELIT